MIFTGLLGDAASISLYYQQDVSELVWNIAADSSGVMSPNVLSELTFTDIDSSGLGLQMAFQGVLSQRWVVFTELDYYDSSVDSGNVRDSDYLGNHRTQELFRAFARLNNDSLETFSFSVGLKTQWYAGAGNHLSVYLGHDKRKLYLTMVDGISYHVPSGGVTPLPDLNSTYNSEFETDFVGVATEHVFSWGTIGFAYELHQVDFEAYADWNLRSDFAHPVSFVHDTNGTGTVLTLGYTYSIDRQWDVYFNVRWLDYPLDNGTDQVFYYDGSSSSTRLNEVEFESKSYQLGLRYTF